MSDWIKRYLELRATKKFLMDSFSAAQLLSFHEMLFWRTWSIEQKNSLKTQKKTLDPALKKLQWCHFSKWTELFGNEEIVACEWKRKMCVVWIHKSWSRPMKCYYPTNCPEAILTSKRGRIDSGFVLIWTGSVLILNNFL